MSNQVTILIRHNRKSVRHGSIYCVKSWHLEQARTSFLVQKHLAFSIKTNKQTKQTNKGGRKKERKKKNQSSVAAVSSPHSVLCTYNRRVRLIFVLKFDTPAIFLMGKRRGFEFGHMKDKSEFRTYPFRLQFH